MLGKVVGTISTATGQVACKVSEWIGLTVVFAGTFNSAAGAFEVSMDSTNGVDGTWFPIQALRSNGSIGQENAYLGLTNTQAYFWHVNLGSWDWFRVRNTNLTSGSIVVTIAPYNQPMTQPSLVVSPHTGALGRLKSTMALTLTSDVAVFPSPGTGRSNNVSDIQAINTGAASVDLLIKENSVVIWQLTLPVNVPVSVSWQNPLRTPVNTALNAALSAAGTVRLNVSGFVTQ